MVVLILLLLLSFSLVVVLLCLVLSFSLVVVLLCLVLLLLLCLLSFVVESLSHSAKPKGRRRVPLSPSFRWN